MANKILTKKIAEPYASALLDLAMSTNTLDSVTTDINAFLKFFKINKDLQAYLTNPLYSNDSKKDILKQLIRIQSANQNTNRFFMTLADRSRIDLFPMIAEKYLELVYNLANVKIANVISAFQLTPEQEIEIITQLKKRTNAKEIKLICLIDKKLLGGLKVQIGSNVIDVSLKGQLRQLAAKLETTLF